MTVDEEEKPDREADKSRPEPPVPDLDLRPHWSLDFSIIFLNHGSFGAVPRRIQNFQRELHRQIEAQPVRFFTQELPALLNRTRVEFAEFVGAHPQNIGFITNATEGVNAVLRSLELKTGDEILVTTHGYPACTNACRFVAKRSGAKVVTAHIPFPLQSPDEVTQTILEAVTEKTRLALIDHITSPSGLVLPIEQIVKELQARGVETLVDGAHAPGMVELNLDALGAAYYTGNCHKWLCTPRGAAFLHVRDDLLSTVRPLNISYGAELPSQDPTRFRQEFDWTGTRDPTAWLSIIETIRFLRSLLPGRFDGIRRRNTSLAFQAQQLLCEALEIERPCPASMIGFMAAVPLPITGDLTPSVFEPDPLKVRLSEEYGIEVPIFPLHDPPARLLRVSAHLYNRLDDFEALADALQHELGPQGLD